MMSDVLLRQLTRLPIARAIFSSCCSGPNAHLFRPERSRANSIRLAVIVNGLRRLMSSARSLRMLASTSFFTCGWKFSANCPPRSKLCPPSSNPPNDRGSPQSHPSWKPCASPCATISVRRDLGKSAHLLIHVLADIRRLCLSDLDSADM